MWHSSGNSRLHFSWGTEIPGRWWILRQRVWLVVSGSIPLRNVSRWVFDTQKCLRGCFLSTAVFRWPNPLFVLCARRHTVLCRLPGGHLQQNHEPQECPDLPRWQRHIQRRQESHLRFPHWQVRRWYSKVKSSYHGILSQIRLPLFQGPSVECTRYLATACMLVWL